MRIDDPTVLKRAKENAARNGLQWEAAVMETVPGAKLQGALDEAGRKHYLNEARHQLLGDGAA